MADYKLTAEELLLVYLTLLARDEEDHCEYFSQWFNNGGKDRLRDLFNSLKEKQVILKSYNPDHYAPNEIEFNKHFLKYWKKSSGQMGKELFTAYPSFMNINGRYAPLKDISKKFNSLDEFFFFYAKEIGFDEEKHKEILELINWAVKNDKLNFGILSFVISNQWEMLKELRDNPNIVPVATTFDVYQTV